MAAMIFNRDGQRKYLTPEEVESLIAQSKHFSTSVQMFCMMIAYTGCRISEALSMTKDSIDFTSKHVVIRCLKKRGKMVFRSIPLPPKFLNIIDRWIKKERSEGGFLWPWSRMTGYRRIREIMSAANIRGRHASPKGLRHGFGVRAVQASVPLTLVQRWLGHADIKTTAIYTNAIGPEERRIAARMWRTNPIAKEKPQKCEIPRRRSLAAKSAMNSSNTNVAKVANKIHVLRVNLPSRLKGGSILEISPITQTPSQSYIDGKATGCPLIHFWLKRNKIYHFNSNTYSDLSHLGEHRRYHDAPRLINTNQPNPSQILHNFMAPVRRLAPGHAQAQAATFVGHSLGGTNHIDWKESEDRPMSDEHDQHHGQRPEFDKRAQANRRTFGSNRSIMPLTMLAQELPSLIFRPAVTNTYDKFCGN